ncbi:unnamed protein product, partial [Pocillopora meandrina]
LVNQSVIHSTWQRILTQEVIILSCPDSSGLHLCEFLAIDKYSVTKKLQGNNSFYHFSLASPCDSAPCKNRTVYVPEYQWDSYHSECHPEFCGINCDRKGSRNCVKLLTLVTFSRRISKRRLQDVKAVSEKQEYPILSTSFFLTPWVVRKAANKCSETIVRKTWEVQEFIGQHTRAKLLDNSLTVSWGHINFEDLTGDISCGTDL